jgi:hypothetical protein
MPVVLVVEPLPTPAPAPPAPLPALEVPSVPLVDVAAVELIVEVELVAVGVVEDAPLDPTLVAAVSSPEEHPTSPHASEIQGARSAVTRARTWRECER